MVFGFGKPNLEKMVRKSDVDGLVKAVENSNNRKSTIDAIHHLALVISSDAKNEKKEKALEALRKLMWHKNPEVKEIALAYMTEIVSPVIGEMIREDKAKKE